jgi:hypothetical protein
MKSDLFGYQLRVWQRLSQEQLEHSIPKRVPDFGADGLQVMPTADSGERPIHPDSNG